MKMDMDTKALIFAAGQVDQFGRRDVLAVYGTTVQGLSVCAARNVTPSVQGVQHALDLCEAARMTNVHVTYDSCG